MKKNGKAKEMEPVSMDVIETSDTTAPATSAPGDTPAGTTDTPTDGEGCESVTVIIAQTHLDHPEYAKTAARSVKQNLIGADALVFIMVCNPETTMVETLQRALEMVGTERIVLMTDDMLILNPTTIYELGCRRVISNIDKVPTPMLMHKSALAPLLDYMKAELPYADVMLEYDRQVRNVILPATAHPWNKDNWLLPVVTENPSLEVLRTWAATQRFLFINRPKWPRSVVKFLDEKFPE